MNATTAMFTPSFYVYVLLVFLPVYLTSSVGTCPMQKEHIESE